jgi:hypothetical protein
VELTATTHYRKCLPEPIFSSLLGLHCNSQRVLDQSKDEEEEDPKPKKKFVSASFRHKSFSPLESKLLVHKALNTLLPFPDPP